VAFPPGEWLIEFRRTPPQSQPRDYFVFKRVSPPVHRLAVLRYSSVRAAPALYMYLDGLHETMGDGVPMEERWPKEDEVYGVFPMRQEPQDVGKVSDIDFSFVAQGKSGTSWLTHTHLWRRYDNWTFIFVYASTEVTSPEVLDEVQGRSELLAAPRSQ
jgi:hypothetical protein